MHSATWLETYDSAGAALSVVIEGSPVTFGTASDMTGTYSGAAAPYDDFDDPIGGLYLAGEIAGAIRLYTPDIEADSLEFKILDTTGVLLGTLLREGSSDGLSTYLTTSLTNSATTALVRDTTGFAASGTIYCGGEAISYTSTTATTFNGLTRGLYTLNLRDNGNVFVPAHTIGNNVVASATTAPAVTDFPRTWYGRFIHLMLHVRDPLTGDYNVASEARKLWTGRIDSYGDNGDGSVTISAKSVMSLLHNVVGASQWRAKVNEGLVVGTNMDTIKVHNTATPTYTAETDLGFTQTRKSHEEVAEAINAQFRAWRVAGTGAGGTRAGDIWSLELTERQDGSPPVYVFHLRSNTVAVTAPNWASITLHKNMWKILGWGDGGSGPLFKVLQFDTTTHSSIEAPMPPIVYEHENIDYYMGLDLTDEINSFVVQDYKEIDPGLYNANGVIEIRGGQYSGIYAVSYSAGYIGIEAQLDKTTNKWRRNPANADTTANGPIRLGEATEPPEVRQVTYQVGDAGALLLKLAMSTGTAAFNHATYDAFTTAGFGAAIPASLIHIDSWEEMDDVKIQLLITDQRPFYKYLEQALAASNRYVVWRSSGPESQPQLSIVRPSLETTFAASWNLTESNKAGALQGAERCRVARASEGIINSIVLKHGNNLSAPDQGLHSLTVEHVASQSDYGRKRTVTIEAPSILNAADLIDTTLGPALAYFSRPLATVERTYNASCIRMAPGDTVTLTDDYVTNPATGLRGEAIYCWVLNASFDLASGIGRCKLIFLPEKDVNYSGIWGPSGRVDETYTSGTFTAGYSSSTSTLRLKINEFSSGFDNGDASAFKTGDRVHIYALDEAAPLEWFDVVLQTGGSFDLPLTTGLAGYDTSKIYVVEYDDISAALNTAQRQSAFIADDSSLSTGYTTPTPYQWGQRGVSVTAGATIDYTQGMFRPNTTYDDQGEPLSVHKQTYLIKAANNLLAYKTRNVLLSEYFVNEAETAAEDVTPEIMFMALVPYYGGSIGGARDLVFRLLGRNTGGGISTFTIASSSHKPIGGTWADFSFPSGANVATATVNSSSLVWTAEAVVTAVPAAFVRHGQQFTWITIYGGNENTAEFTRLRQVCCTEAALT